MDIKREQNRSTIRNTFSELRLVYVGPSRRTRAEGGKESKKDALPKISSAQTLKEVKVSGDLVWFCCSER